MKWLSLFLILFSACSDDIHIYCPDGSLTLDKNIVKPDQVITPDQSPCANTLSATTSWHIAIEQQIMYTNCGNQTNIVVGSAFNCSDAITVSQNLFNNTIMNCVMPDCKTLLEMTFPGLTITNMALVSIVIDPASCVVDPYVINGNNFTRYQVGIPYKCIYCMPTTNPCKVCNSDLDCPSGFVCKDDDNQPSTLNICTKSYIISNGCPTGMYGDYNISKYCICRRG